MNWGWHGSADEATSSQPLLKRQSCSRSLAAEREHRFAGPPFDLLPALSPVVPTPPLSYAAGRKMGVDRFVPQPDRPPVGVEPRLAIDNGVEGDRNDIVMARAHQPRVGNHDRHIGSGPVRDHFFPAPLRPSDNRVKAQHAPPPTSIDPPYFDNASPPERPGSTLEPHLGGSRRLRLLGSTARTAERRP